MADKDTNETYKDPEAQRIMENSDIMELSMLMIEFQDIVFDAMKAVGPDEDGPIDDAIVEAARSRGNYSDMEALCQKHFGNDLLTCIKLDMERVLETMPEEDTEKPQGDDEKGVEYYIDKELRKEKWIHYTFADLHTITGEDGITTLWDEVLQAAKRQRQQDRSRKKTKTAKHKAYAAGALMNPVGDYLISFSSEIGFDAFSPDRLYTWGGDEEPKFDRNGQLINKVTDKKIANASYLKASISHLLVALFEGSTEDCYNYLAQNKPITFSVKAFYDRIYPDHKGDKDSTKQITRSKEVERLIKSLEPYIGVMPDGSRFQYVANGGYDAETDTYTISLPYIGALFQQHQARYFYRQEKLIGKRNENKKPSHDEKTPLELNKLFKTSAFTQDPVTYDIAVYLTTKMLQAGAGKRKMQVRYETIIKECPAFDITIKKIRNDQRAGDLDRKKAAMRINSELKKICSAERLIMNKKYCDASIFFKGIKFSNQKNDKFIAPTSSCLSDTLIVTWYAPETETAT